MFYMQWTLLRKLLFLWLLAFLSSHDGSLIGYMYTSCERFSRQHVMHQVSIKVVYKCYLVAQWCGRIRWYGFFVVPIKGVIPIDFCLLHQLLGTRYASVQWLILTFLFHWTVKWIFDKIINVYILVFLRSIEKSLPIDSAHLFRKSRCFQRLT